MVARSLCIVVLAGCFTARTPAERSRTTSYNVAVALGGIAAAALGYELAKASADTDGLGPMFGAMFGGGGIVGGAFMTIGGIGGVVLTELDYVPTHKF
jgi:hypothetical protein